MGIAMMRNGRPNMSLAAKITAAAQAVQARQSHEEPSASDGDTPADPPAEEVPGLKSR
jgi:hypothetical protein